MPLYSSKQRKIIFAALILLLGFVLIYALREIFTAILGAVVLYTLFKPLYVWATNRAGINRSLSGILVILISFLIIIFPLLLLGYMIIGKIQEFQSDPQKIAAIIAQINTFAGSSFDKPNLVESELNNIPGWVMGSFTTILNNVFQTVIIIIVLYFILYFMLTSHEIFEDTIQKYLPFNKETSERFGTELKNITYSNILGQGMIALSQGVIVGIGFFIFGIPDKYFWGVIAIFVCFLPIVGAPIICIPAGIFEMAYGHTTDGVGIIIWGMVLALVVDNFLRTMISKKIARAHPLITIIGVVIGIPVFGLLGLIVGPLLLSYFILMVVMYETKYSAGFKQSGLLNKEMDGEE